MPTRDAISDEAVPITEVTASGNGEDDPTAAVVIPAAAVAAIEEEQEVLHASIRSASVAQMVIAIIAVLGLFYLGVGHHLHFIADRLYSRAPGKFSSR